MRDDPTNLSYMSNVKTRRNIYDVRGSYLFNTNFNQATNEKFTVKKRDYFYLKKNIIDLKQSICYGKIFKKKALFKMVSMQQKVTIFFMTMKRLNLLYGIRYQV